MLLLSLIILCLSPILIVLCWWYYLYFIKFRALRNIPGPEPLPVIGNVLELGGNPKEFLFNFTRLQNEYGKMYKIFVGFDVRVVHTDPDVIEQILISNKEITKSSSYEMVKSWICDGLLTSTGNKWRARRKLITPSFHFAALEGYVKTFDRIGNSLVNKLRNLDERKPIDIYHYINLFALDVICETSMGKNIDSLENENATFVQAVNGYLRFGIVRVFSLWKQIDLLYKLTQDYPLHKSFTKVLHNLGDEVFQSKQEELRKFDEDNVDEEQDEKVNAQKFSLIDRLLRQQNFHRLSNSDIKEEINTFIFEGHDTVSSGLSFMIYALAANPEIQEKVYKEVMTVFSDDDEEVTISKIQQLEYLDLVVKESQRRYPSVPFYERKLTNNMTIKGQMFPKDTLMSVFPYGMHNSKDIFENPEKFDPDRFLPKNIKGRPHFAYVPFSAGPRNCIGQKFAVLEMKSTISKLLRNFEFLSVPGHELILAVAGVLKADNGVMVRIKKRLQN